MKYAIHFLGLLLINIPAAAQTDSVEFLQTELNNAHTVKERIDLLNKLSYQYTQLSLTSAESFANEALEKAREVNYEKGIATSYNNLGISHSIRGDYTAGLDYFIRALRIRESLNDLAGASKVLGNMARVFHYQGDFEKAIAYSNRSMGLLQKADDSIALAQVHISLGEIYLSMQDRNRALAEFEKSREIFVRKGRKNEEGWSLLKMANVFEADKNYDRALEVCFEATKLIDVKTDLFTTIELYQSVGSIYAGMGNRTEARNYLHQALQLSDGGKDSNGSISTRLKLANMFRQFGQYDSALYYMDAYATRYAEAFNIEKSRQLNTLEKIYQADQKDKLLELQKEKIRTQSMTIAVISLLLVGMGVLGFVIYRYYKGKKQSAMELKRLNKEIHEKHEEILAQAEELTQANEEISRMNETLEAEVMLRAQEIEDQNKKLIDYAYFNAHSVRGPVARILGLTMLMEREGDVTQIKEYNRYLMISAQELDGVIKEINSKLEG